MLSLKGLGHVLSKQNSLEKAIRWVKRHRVPGNGIVVHHKTGLVTQEVTGYLVCSLYNVGEKDLAIELARWLAGVQQADGAFLAPSGGKYTFDTAQVMRGFLSVVTDAPELKDNLRSASEYVCSQIDAYGQVHTTTYSAWKLPDGSIFSPYCDLYVLPPLFEAGRFFGERRYTEAARRALQRFKQQGDLVDFKPELGTISHIFGYMLEALVDLGETELAAKGLAQAEAVQKRNGAIPAYPGAHWICSTGMAQLALAWFKSGNMGPAKKAFDYLERIQNPSGGFYGSYGIGGKYFPGKEISWAAKFFIDAHQWNVKSAFDKDIHILDRIDDNDGRLNEITKFLAPIQQGRIADIGCGKGRYFNALKKHFPRTELHGMDIAESLLRSCPAGVHTACGSMLNIPYPDRYFDGVFSVEALEHAVMIDNAVSEMSRILKPGGRIVVIDKNIHKHGSMRTLSWEKWFDPHYIVSLFAQNHVKAEFKYIAGGRYSRDDELFVFWSGIKEK